MANMIQYVDDPKLSAEERVRRQKEYYQAHLEVLRSEIDRLKKVPESEEETLPAISEDGIDMALKGLSLEVMRQVAGRPTMNTFDAVKQISQIGHQIVLLRTLLRDLTIQDLEAGEGMFPDEIAVNYQEAAGYYGNNYVCGPGVGGNDLEARVARRVRARGARRFNIEGAAEGQVLGQVDRMGNLHQQMNVGGVRANPQNPDPYHNAQGYGRRNEGRGAPYTAWAGDIREEDELAANLDRARDIGVEINALKTRRNELARENDNHPDLAGLNAMVTRLKNQRREILNEIAGKNAEPEKPEAPKKEEGEPHVVHDCDNEGCDQIQGPFWRTADGDPMDCDVCGSPMTQKEVKDEPRKEAEQEEENK